MADDQHPNTWRVTLVAVALILALTAVCVLCQGWNR